VSLGVQAWLASLIAALVSLRSLLVAFVLAALLSLALRSLLLAALERGGSVVVTLLRLAAVLSFGALGALYTLFAARWIEWTPSTFAVALATGVGLVGSVWLRRRPAGNAGLPSPLAALAQLALLLGLLLLAALTLVHAGFLALTEDRPVLLVDITGETRVQMVRWAPPGHAAREEPLTTYRVAFRMPDGQAVAEAFLYGDQVAVKGRVLRLAPLLNAAGVPNLLELQFAHNGYLTAERHASLPHAAVPLPPTGPLAVHPWWRPLQSRLLEAWEKGAEGSGWAVRSVTTESTYYPLVDNAGRPLRRTFRLVLTPGGLSAS
jgi:hypothetical protein